MTRYAEKKSNAIVYIIIVIIIILLVAGVYFLLNNKSITTNGDIVQSINLKGKIITAENYDEMMDKIEQNMKDDDELYYLSYSMMYYMFQDGLASAFTNPDDESAMYVNIYGKTIQQLIDEGKELMKENDMTIEKFKEELKNIDTNTVAE